MVEPLRAARPVDVDAAAVELEADAARVDGDGDGADRRHRLLELLLAPRPHVDEAGVLASHAAFREATLLVLRHVDDAVIIERWTILVLPLK